MKKILKYSAMLLSLLLIVSFAGITAFAEPEDEPTNSSPVETVTDPPTDPPTEPETDPPTDPPTEPEPEPTEPEPTSEETEPTEETEETEEESSVVPSDSEEPSYDIDDLPPIEENEFIVPTSIITEAPVQTATVAAGIISWICVAIGVIVIIAVLGSSKTGNYMNGGKQRYESGDIISGGKRR